MSPKITGANWLIATCKTLMQSMVTLLSIGAISALAFAQVGMQEITLNQLPVTLIYPTEETTQPHHFGPFEIHVALNAKPSTGNGRLVVMSFGTGSSPLADNDLARSLAKAGYLVAQPVHAGDNYKDTSQAGPESWKKRPVEITKTIDALTQHPQWSTWFDPQKIGVHGMSAGGISVLALLGGQWNMLTMIKHCHANLEADLGFCLNGLAGQEEKQNKRRKSYAQGAKAPEMFLPAHLKERHGAKDTRIKAASLAVPLVAPFTQESLKTIHTPVGIVGAKNDELLNPAFHSNYLLQNCTSCTLLTHLKNAGHFDVLSPWPTAIAQEVSAMQMRGGQPHPQFQANDRQAAFTSIVQFFDRHLK